MTTPNADSRCVPGVSPGVSPRGSGQTRAAVCPRVPSPTEGTHRSEPPRDTPTSASQQRDTPTPPSPPLTRRDPSDSVAAGPPHQRLDGLRILTVQQPWAWAIVHAGKDVENRTQAWSHRGPLAIHAGTRWSDRGGDSVLIRNAFLGADQELDRRDFRFGAILGVVDLTGVHTAEEGCCGSAWGERSYAEHGGRTRRDVVHLELRDPRPLRVPVPCRGRLGLWAPGPELAAEVAAELAEVAA